LKQGRRAGIIHAACHSRQRLRLPNLATGDWGGTALPVSGRSRVTLPSANSGASTEREAVRRLVHMHRPQRSFRAPSHWRKLRPGTTFGRELARRPCAERRDRSGPGHLA
jgi:hypothetical protein